MNSSPPPWSAERVVRPELAQRLLESQFPHLRPVNLERFGEGWDNTAYLVNALMVFRFPRRQSAVPLLDVESRILPRIAGHLPVAVPRPSCMGRPTREYPWAFAGYPLLTGCTADVVGLDDRGRDALAQPLGAFLAALHALPADGLDGDTIGRADPGRLIGRIATLLPTLPEDPAPLRRIVERSSGLGGRSRQVLVHGDLYIRHLLVDDDGRLSGIIDWGDVHRGDPAVDLSIAWSFLPPDARGTFLAAYGMIDDSTWRLARLRALHYAVVLDSYGRGVGDERVVREARTMLRLVSSE